MAEYINIAPREHVEKRITMEAKAGEGYTESTGNREAIKYTGTWGDMLAHATLQMDASGGQAQVTCELERLEGGMGELTITKETYRKPEGSGGAGESGDEGGGGQTGGQTGGELGSEENPTYTSSCTLMPVSILTHHKFANLAPEELRALKAMIDGQDENNALSDDAAGATGSKRIIDMIKSPAALVAADYIRRGVTQYAEPVVQVTARWKARVNKYTAGAIIASVPGGIIQTPAGRNWRVEGTGTDKQGSTVWQTATFALSGQDGWDEYLYGSGSS